MTKPLFTKEEAEQIAADIAMPIFIDMVSRTEIFEMILAALAMAEAEFQKRLEEAPTVTGAKNIGGTMTWAEGFSYASDTHTAKLMNIEPIGEEKP